MLLVFDRNNSLSIYQSSSDAEAGLETIDIENGEYEFCDETGQPYVGDVLKLVTKWSGGDFRIVPRGARDPGLPLSFVLRATDYRSKVPELKTQEAARL